MNELRLGLYLAGMIAAGTMALRLFSIRNRLAFLFGLVMVGWVVNCGTLGVMLVYTLATGFPLPPWRNALLTVNAVLLGLLPAGLYLFFLYLKPEGEDGFTE